MTPSELGDIVQQAVFAAGTQKGGAKGKDSKPSGGAAGKSKHKSGAGSDQRRPPLKGSVLSPKAMPKVSKADTAYAKMMKGRKEKHPELYFWGGARIDPPDNILKFREAKEGAVGVYSTKDLTTIIQINTETDFAAKNEVEQKHCNLLLKS